jgi:WD40 repeat protein
VLSDGRLLSWSADGTLRLWTSNGEAVAELAGHSRSVTGATVLNDGRVLSWSADGTLRLWASDATALAAPKGHRSPVRDTLVLSDGRLLSWTDERSGTMWLWDADGAALAELKGHSSWVVGARTLSDGRLLSWSDDGTLRLWMADGAALAEMKGHGSIVESAIALSDGRLLSWSRDGTLRLWTSDGASLAEMKGHSGPVEGAVGLTDGQIMSWSKDGTLRLWASDGTFLSLWLWPYAGVVGVTRVIPHPNRAGVYWVIAGNDVLQVRHQPKDILDEDYTHDVFLSYAREDTDIVCLLYDDLAAAGFSVWYDKDVVGGDRYRDRIRARIDAAKAVVVLWSKASVEADWVIAEASRAHAQGKLVPLRLPPLASGEIPDPFGVLSTVPHGDLDALKRALRHKGLSAR